MSVQTDGRVDRSTALHCGLPGRDARPHVHDYSRERGPLTAINHTPILPVTLRTVMSRPHTPPLTDISRTSTTTSFYDCQNNAFTNALMN